MLRPGKGAPSATGGQHEPSSSGATGKQPPAAPVPDASWLAAPAVKVIIAALVIFFLLHLFMWYVVYGHMRDRFDDSLRESVDLAWKKLKEVADHL